MLLAVDVGNTQTVLGLYDGDRLTDDWRLATERTRTGDELGVLLGGMLDLDDVDGICLSSTVPTLIREWERVAARWAHVPVLVVGPGVKTGIPIRYDDPREVGPDRIVNSIAAKERYGATREGLAGLTSVRTDNARRRGNSLHYHNEVKNRSG